MRQAAKVRTALARTEEGNLRVIRDDWYATNAEFASELRANGLRVLRVWARDVSDAEVDEWEFMNRK